MSEGKLAGKVAIITGGSRGIGRALAKGFAAQGAKVVVSARSEEGSEAVAAEIRAAGGESLAVAADVTKYDEVEAMVVRTVEEFGRVDIVVANAGIPQARPSEELRPEEWQQVMDINLNGVFYTCQTAGKRMLAQGSGAILTIGSLLSFIGVPERLAYGTTKGGIIEFTRVLAVEWAARGVRVNALAPGYIKTDIMEGMIAKGKLDPSALIRRTPMQRLGAVEDLVGPAVFLVSDDAAFVTGQTLAVDGGWLAYGFV